MLQKQVEQGCPKDARIFRKVIFFLQKALLEFFEDFIKNEEFQDLKRLSSVLNTWPAYLKEKEEEEGFPFFCSSYKCYEKLKINEKEMIIWTEGLYVTLKIARIKKKVFRSRKGVRKN